MATGRDVAGESKAPKKLTATDPTLATPQGEADKRRRDEWLLLALITLGDIDASRHLWESLMPRNLRGVPTGGDGWAWDAGNQIYVSRTGQKIDGDGMKQLATMFATSVEHDLRSEASNMAVGLLPVDEWQRRTADTVKDLHIGHSALAAGGFDRLTPELLKYVQGLASKPPGVSFSLDKLADFAGDVVAGADRAATEDAIVYRAGLYAAASQSTFEEVKRESHKGVRDDKGRLKYLYERNVLGSENPCRPSENADGCLELTEAGWLPIGSMSLPGTRTCKMACRCYMQYSLIGPALGTN